jgi:hypothetical protein
MLIFSDVPFIQYSRGFVMFGSFKNYENLTSVGQICLPPSADDKIISAGATVHLRSPKLIQILTTYSLTRTYLRHSITRIMLTIL